jgi:hypothetical protein
MRPTPPPPYIYANPLPTGAVATVNDEKVTQARLLEYVLNGNLQQAMENLVMANVLELELAKNGIDVTDEEIATERTAIVARVSPGRKPEDLIKEGVFSEFEINRQARMARGWDKIIWKKQNVPEDKRTEQGNPMIRAIFMRQAMQDYDIRRRGSDPAPALGLVAQIVSRDGKGPTISVTADQSLDFLMGLVKPGALTTAMEDLVLNVVVAQELAKAKARSGRIRRRSLGSFADREVPASVRLAHHLEDEGHHDRRGARSACVASWRGRSAPAPS